MNIDLWTIQARRWLTAFLVTALLTSWAELGQPPAAQAAAALELYGNFHAMGVVVNLTAGEDPDQDATASVSYRVSGSGAYQPGFPLSRVTSTRFAGSLFWLTPGTAYDVRVTFADPDGGPLNGVTVQATASTRAEISIPAPNNSFYVSPAGSGTACSLAAPCALSYGLNQAQAGDAVMLRGGVYYEGEFSLPRSGAAGAPIVVRSYPGETAILDGADPTDFAWTPQGGGVYVTTVNAPDPHLIVANGQRLYPYQSLSDLQNLIWGIPGFYASGATVYVRLAGDADPNSAAMLVSRYNTAFTVEQNFIYFVNLTFRYYGQGSYAKAVYFFDGSDNLVQGSTFAVNDLGIGLKYDSHRNVIQDNVFYDTLFDWPWDGVKAEGNLETGGIRFYGPTTGRGTVIRRNTFHDYFDGFGACPDATGGLTNETDVYENLVYNTGDDGMETDGECSNVRIWGNTFHDVLMGISLAPAYTGPVYAIRNLIYRTGVGNSVYTGSPFKFNSGYSTSGPMYLFHNTADAALSDDDGPNNGLYVKSPGTWRLIYARNNVWAGTGYAVENYNTSQPIDLDYDDLWREDAGNLMRWNNVNYATLAAFTAATGQEPNGRSVTPSFANRASGDYTLAAASGLIDAGVIVPGVNDGYVGAAPDLGAFERAVSAVADLRVTNAIAASGTLTATLGWSPPSDAVTYTIRYSASLITEANWASASLLTSTLPGSANSYTAILPYGGGTVYFALKSQNAQGEFSILSNNAFWPRWDVYLPLVSKS